MIEKKPAKALDEIDIHFVEKSVWLEFGQEPQAIVIRLNARFRQTVSGFALPVTANRRYSLIAAVTLLRVPRSSSAG
jgi:hypothetical protein